MAQVEEWVLVPGVRPLGKLEHRVVEHRVVAAEDRVVAAEDIQEDVR